MIENRIPKLAALLYAILQPIPVYAQAENCGPERNITALLTEALSRHPSLESFQKRAELEQNRAATVGLTPDPQVRIVRDRTKFPFYSSEEQSRWQLSITQSLPWFGTLSAEENLQDSKKSLADAKTKEASQSFGFEFLRQSINLSKLLTDLSIEKENQTEIRRLLPLIEARFSQGRGSHASLLNVEIETDVSELSISQLNRNIENSLLEVSHLIQCNLNQSDLPNDFQTQVERLLTESESSSSKTLTFVDTEVLKNQAERQILAKSAEFKRKKLLPKFSVMAMLSKTDDLDPVMWGAAIGFSVPIFSFNAISSFSQEETAAAQIETAETNSNMLRREKSAKQIKNRIDESKYELKKIQSSIRPKAKEHLEALYSEFTQARSSASDIISSRRQLLMLERTENALTHEVMAATLEAIATRFGTPMSQAQSQPVRQR